MPPPRTPSTVQTSSTALWARHEVRSGWLLLSMGDYTTAASERQTIVRRGGWAPYVIHVTQRATAPAV